MALRISDECFGCGGCELACPQAAITQAPGFPVAYVIDPLLCNDCNTCVPLCPVDAFLPDPAWAVCYGRGCPLSSKRYAGWECTEGRERCPACGSMLWRPPGATYWRCRRCDYGEGTSRASCPKVRKSELAKGATLS
jgi:NAD-dependent dihydropyrimidine dehydrogenase PreA subunit